MSRIWNSIKITPVNPSVVFSLKNKSFLTRKLAGLAVHYIIRSTYSKLTVNPRYHENSFVLNGLHSLVPKGSKVLDIGSAESDFPLYLHASGFEVIPFDQREYPLLPSVQGDAMKLDHYFQPSTFDAITVISTLEHIGIGAYGDVRNSVTYLSLIGLWKALLKPEGCMLITLPVTSGDTRREPGQWVVNLASFRESLLEANAITLLEKLVVERSSLPCGWEEVQVDTGVPFSLGVYMCAIHFTTK
jgi:hypothetical protein